MDIKIRRDASWGRKSKAGGGESKATQEYTPLSGTAGTFVRVTMKFPQKSMAETKFA